MKVLLNKFDKHVITGLPQVLFPGRIIVIYTEGEAEKAVNFLLTHPILGIDTETRPSFRRGQSYPVGLLQVSTYDTCFLFRLNRMGLPSSLVRLLEDTEVLKVGLSLKDDFLSLHKRAAFTPGNFVDLQHYVRLFGIEDMSLQKLYANVFGQKISKTQRLTNWDADILTDKQKRYAATDAWACICLYEELKRLEENQNYILQRVSDENPPANGQE